MASADETLKKGLEWLKSEEGKKSIEEYFSNIERLEAMKENQLDRFHIKYNTKELFVEFLEKVIIKYNSKEYNDRWYNRGTEPPESLYFFLFNYAQKYGRECDDAEWAKYGNMFSGDLYFIHGYYFNIMHGQGTVIKVTKADKDFLNYII
jgi:hypothetical protein